jgi:outer membrane protein assembly factor BamB
MIVAVVGVVALAALALTRTGPLADGGSRPASDASPSAGPVAVHATQAAPSGAASAPEPDPERWSRMLSSPVSALYATPDGLVAVADDRIAVLDPATGAVRDDLALDTGGAGAVATGGRVVTADGEGLHAVDVRSAAFDWEAPVRAATALAADGDTVYGVSDDEVPQLVAMDARSGERLWAFPEGEQAFPADVGVTPGEQLVYVVESNAVLGILPTGAVAQTDSPDISASETSDEPLCLWREEVDAQLWTGAMHAVADGVAIAEQSGRVCVRRHQDGTPLWCAPVRGVAETEPTLLADDERLYVVTPTAMTALDLATGAQDWMLAGEWSMTAFDGRGNLVAVDSDGAVSLVSGEAGVARAVDVSVGSTASLVVGDDRLYAARGDGTVVGVTLGSVSG